MVDLFCGKPRRFRDNPTALSAWTVLLPGLADERIVIGSSSAEPFHIALWQKHLPALYAKFPKLKADIDRWLYHADKAVNSIPVYVLSRLLPQWLQDLVGPYLLKTFRKYAGMTTEEAFELVTENVELRNLLSSLWIDIGSPPVRGTFMLTAAVVHGFPQRGGAYPRGGSEELGMALVRTIERYGGKVLVKAEVAEILTEKQAGGWKATGVKLRDGTVVKAGTVVSSIGYSNTWNKLVSQAVTKDLGIPRTLDDKIPPSAGFVMVNIGFKATRKEMELGSFNTWYLPTDKKGDCFGAIREQFADPVGWIEEAPCMITFPSIKDRAFDEPRETCQVLVMIDGNPHFEKWLGKESGKAKEGADMEEYEALKKKWGDACVKRVMELYPKIKQEHIGLVDVSTPCSIAHYIRSPGGGAVGLDQTPRRFTDPELQRLLDTRTKVEGLWQTGQDTLICGQPLVQLAGMITAWRWLGFWKTAGLVLQTAMWELEMDEEDT